MNAFTSRGKLAENIRRTFCQNLKPAVNRAETETTENEDGSSSKDEESNEEESGKGESAGHQSSSDQDSGEGSGTDEVEEQEELMAVEQAEFINSTEMIFFGNFNNYEKFSMRNT